MRILKFETKNHPILGDCDLNFSLGSAIPDVVLIAGSNGSGKTTILNEIFEFFNRIYPRDEIYDLAITFNLEQKEVDLLRGAEPAVDQVLKLESLRKDSFAGLSWDQIRAYNSKQEINHSFARGELFQEMLKVVYSTVEINFAKNEISSTTARNIDSNKAPREKSDGNVSKEIAQLLVDIKGLDNQDAADWMDSNHGQSVQVLSQEKRIGRFKKAFDYMIEGKTFQGVKNEDQKKKVYFKDSQGNEIDISDLSSGEKQIVFRAGYLLKNMGSLSGGIVLIDEPEISFHPAWQEKYIQFVKKIFSNDEGVLQAQIIIATHSPFIIQNQNISNERIIILERNNNGTAESAWPKFYGYKQPEPIFIPQEKPLSPLLLVEGKSDKLLLNSAWSRLYPNEEKDFDIEWAGEPNAGGAGMLQRQLNVLQQHATQKILGLFDADEKGLNDYKGTKTGQNIEFLVDDQVPSLKILNKVGATYLPTPDFRNNYFNLTHPKFSLLTLELFLSDSVLESLDILEPEKIKVMGGELVGIKTNHSISEISLLSLTKEDFRGFQMLFDYIKMCFGRIQ